MGGAAVLAVSTREELAVQLAPRTVAERRVGTAARVPSSRGGARALATMVFSADWHPDGSDLAVSTYNDQRAAIEFPSGKVLARPDRISLIRFSGDGRFVVYCGAQVDTPVTINVVRAAGGESPVLLRQPRAAAALRGIRLSTRSGSVTTKWAARAHFARSGLTAILASCGAVPDGCACRTSRQTVGY